MSQEERNERSDSFKENVGQGRGARVPQEEKDKEEREVGQKNLR